MDGLRSSRTMFASGLLLGMLLVVGPVLQSVQGSCSRSTDSVPQTADRTELVVLSPDEVQWTCSDRVAVVTRAVTSEGPDTFSNGGGTSAAPGAEEPMWTVVKREEGTPDAVFISPVLKVLRPVVLLI